MIDKLINTKNIRLQENSTTCGLASLRNSLLLSYGLNLSESVLLEKAQEIYSRYKKKDLILRDGIGPWGISRLIKENLADIVGISLNVFMTTHGTIEQLEKIIQIGTYPLIHRTFHEDKEGHYELILGTDQNNVHLHNSARYVNTSGVHTKSRKEFNDKWWDFNGERWFLAHYPANIILPRKQFLGRYM